MKATVYGIGAGPGDPSLITLKAVTVLSGLSLLVAPQATEGGESVALGIVSAHLDPQCEVVEAVFPMAEDVALKMAAATGVAARLANAARAGRNAAFVTLGDTMLYSTWGYVLRALRSDHPDVAVQTVPGVPSLCACAALLGEPLAEGRDALLVWPDAPPADLEPLLAVAPNIVAMKAGRHLEALLGAADAAGADVSAVQRCGLERERVAADARELVGGPVEYFTTAIVRKKVEHDGR
ncbi:MAG: precorrin-2 C(20)-methyltransferase [Actinobacteria bacterium]|nr:precorrin-2 C(20)-methyltransferase [Actinomycetota bacterium]MCG2808129.1 precorrin-2 C(20)-methyltransferase [Coriobacteriia bacterium]